MPDPLIRTQADYADALLTARLAKNWCFLILLIILAAQIALFFVVRYSKTDLTPATVAAVPFVLDGANKPLAASPVPPATNRTANLLQYGVGLCGYLGWATVIIYFLLLLIILNIMVVARLVGVGKIVAALIWCILLAVILFPWQAFLNNANLTAVDFKIPGVIYTWNELVTHARFKVRDVEGKFQIDAVLKWARFVGFPIVAILMDAMIQAKSVNGLRKALGEDIAPPTDTVPTEAV